MDDGKQYVDLSEKVTATYYDEEHEEWSERTVTIQDVLDSACYGYTVEPYENPQMICVANVTLTDEQVKEAFEKTKMEILTLQPDLQPTCNKLATDCISRQAAIDAANRTDYRGLLVEDVTKVTDEVVKELKKLPSVHPEPQWIPCSERLPDEGVEVLCCFRNGDNYKIIVSKRTDFNYWSSVGRTGDTIAWMPLPKPWRGEEE